MLKSSQEETTAKLFIFKHVPSNVITARCEERIRFVLTVPAVRHVKRALIKCHISSIQLLNSRRLLGSVRNQEVQITKAHPTWPFTGRLSGETRGAEATGDPSTDGGCVWSPDWRVLGQYCRFYQGLVLRVVYSRAFIYYWEISSQRFCTGVSGDLKRWLGFKFRIIQGQYYYYYHY